MNNDEMRELIAKLLDDSINPYTKETMLAAARQSNGKLVLQWVDWKLFIGVINVGDIVCHVEGKWDAFVGDVQLTDIVETEAKARYAVEVAVLVSLGILPVAVKAKTTTIEASAADYSYRPPGEVDLFAVINREGAAVIKKSIEEAKETKKEIERWHFNPHPEAKIYRLTGIVVE